MERSEAWFQRQLAWCRYCTALADKVSTPDELRMAEMALAVHPSDRQEGLFKGIDHASFVK